MIVPALLALVLAPGVRALNVDGLYEAEVEVADQGDDTRRRAFGSALWDVLVKATGDRTVPSRPELQNLFRDAQKLVQQYRYRELPATAAPGDEALGSLDMAADEAELAPGPSHVLWVQFAPESIERQLGQLGIALWGRERPQTLVWLAVQDGPHRYLLGANQVNEIHTALHEAARSRGVPVLLPVLDVADRAAVRFADIRGSFAGPVLEASRRYGVGSVLAGNLARTGGDRWQVEWTLYRRGQTAAWRAQSPNLDASLLSGIEGVASVLSEELAVTHYGSASGLLRVTVRDLRGMSDYASTLAFLRGLSLVQRVSVERASADQLTLALESRGDIEDLRRAIALSDILAEVRDAPGDASDLHYAFLR